MHKLAHFIDGLERQYYDIMADAVLGKRLKQHQRTVRILTSEVINLMADRDADEAWKQVLAQMQVNLYLLQSLIQIELCYRTS